MYWIDTNKIHKYWCSMVNDETTVNNQIKETRQQKWTATLTQTGKHIHVCMYIEDDQIQGSTKTKIRNTQEKKFDLKVDRIDCF